MRSELVRLSTLLGWSDLGAAPAWWDGPERCPVVLLDLDEDEAGPGAGAARGLAPALPVVVAGLTSAAVDAPAAHRAAALCDVLVGRDDPVVDDLVRTVGRNPLAATALVGLLRGAEGRSVDDGLLLESAVYSALQAGPEFEAWRAIRRPRPGRAEGDAVALERDGDRLDVTLTHPAVRNALSTTMRDQLVDAFRLVAADPSIRAVHLRGQGPAFCAGGDLDEFGTFPDVATAHLVRLQQSVGRAIEAVRDRVTVHLHGACIGSGIELPAFAARVVARADTVIGLPEVGLGLVPGAGGTVSLPRRIGRHRTALLALSGTRIDAPTALAWGLVDAVEG
jgi:enoyl-CoA hydratase/carnithine racemase